jgi:hypothetical protein
MKIRTFRTIRKDFLPLIEFSCSFLLQITDYSNIVDCEYIVFQHKKIINLSFYHDESKILRRLNEK